MGISEGVQLLCYGLSNSDPASVPVYAERVDASQASTLVNSTEEGPFLTSLISLSATVLTLAYNPGE
jgi:hypothetical protein